MKALSEFFDRVRMQVDRRLEGLLPTESQPGVGLVEAMHYALFNGGKRMRPCLVFAAAEAAGELNDSVTSCASAVELIHAYSLVHDDLPAMDNDELRRGKPTLHLAYDEATAILAGDALQTAAFNLLANTNFTSDQQAIACIRELATASGHLGMAGGQYIDLQAVGQQVSIEDLEIMHRLKTGALIRASVRMGAIAANPNLEPPILELLDKFGSAVGLAFQIKDDILDATGDSQEMGKNSGVDAAKSKPNFFSLLGPEEAMIQLDQQLQAAEDACREIGESGNRLAELAHYIVERTH